MRDDPPKNDLKTWSPVSHEPCHYSPILRKNRSARLKILRRGILWSSFIIDDASYNLLAPYRTPNVLDSVKGDLLIIIIEDVWSPRTHT